VIAPAADFRRTLLAAAAESVQSGALLTFGIRPTFPATGYGWIEVGRRLDDRLGVSVCEVVRFVEKPDRARAEAFLSGGRHRWNSGMFVWRTDAILSALSEHAADLAGVIRRASVARSLEAVYANLPTISVDVAVLEKAARVRVVMVDFAWSDVGSWAALSEILPADPNENRAGGGVRVVTEEAAGCIAWGREGELTVLFGVRDLVVVRSGKATLVCPRERSQEIRRIVERLQKDDPSFL
jgi:mannose-1-phosphate guanylyltransferase